MSFLTLTEFLFPRVLAATMAASVVAAVVWAVQASLRRHLSPGWRHALWLLVLARLLVPVFPESRCSLFNLPQWIRRPEPKPQVVVTFADAAPAASELRIDESMPDLPSTPPFDRPRLTVLQVAGSIWFIISTALLLRLGIASCWLRLRLHRTSEPLHPEAIHLFCETRARLRTFCNARLVQSAAVESPGLFGCFRPKLLLPSSLLQQLSAPELRHIFLHELAHLKRADLWTNLLMSVAHAFHWFNPLVWFVLRQLRLERELSCDALALRLSLPEERRSYGETILKLLSEIKPRPALPAVVGIIEEKHSIRLRMQQISNFTGHRTKNVPGFALLTLIAVAVLSNAQSPVDQAQDVQALPSPRTDLQARGVEIIQQDYTRQRAEVERRQKELDEMREELHLTADEDVRQIERERLQAEARYIHFKKLSDEFKSKDRKDLRKIIPTAAPDTAMDRYLADLAKAEQQYASNVNDLGPQHPEIVRLVNLTARINQQIEDRIDGVIAGTEVQVRQSKALVEQLENRLDQVNSHDANRSGPFQRYMAAKRELEKQQRILDTIYLRLLSERQDAQTTPGTRVEPAVAVEDARLLMELGKLDEAEGKLNAVLRHSPDHESAKYYLQQIRTRRLQNLTRLAQAKDNSDPTNRASNRVDGNPGRRNIAKKLDTIRVPEYHVAKGALFSEAVAELHRRVVDADPSHIGANFIINSPSEPALPSAKKGDSPKIEELRIEREISGSNKLLKDVIQDLVAGVSPRLTYSIEDYAVVFKLQPTGTELLYTRSYRVNPRVLRENLEEALRKALPDEPALVDGIREVFSAAGASIAPAPANVDGSTLQNEKAFFLTKAGALLVRATLADLDKVEALMQKLGTARPQVVIEARILEIEPGAAYDTELLLRTTTPDTGASSIATLTGILTDPQFRAVVNSLEGRATGSDAKEEKPGGARIGILSEEDFRKVLEKLNQAKGAQIVAAPRVITLSSRRARVAIEPGPTVDVLPEVQNDGKGIRLTTDLDVPADNARALPPVHVKAEGILNDGDTLVVRPADSPRTVILFLTSTLVDPAGNRLSPSGQKT